MKKISRSVLLNYSAQQMYDLVNDIQAYPEFLPWCAGVQILSRTEQDVCASILMAKMGIRQGFSTHNHLQPVERIEMRLIDGPFSFLQGQWIFKSLHQQACKVSFDIEFEVSNGFMNRALGALFEQIASTLVDSFIQRAQQCYGDDNKTGVSNAH
jgi:ribosome-associated toxin RatA of RatAB toxin-antitoxin module